MVTLLMKSSNSKTEVTSKTVGINLKEVSYWEIEITKKYAQSCGTY